MSGTDSGFLATLLPDRRLHLSLALLFGQVIVYTVLVHAAFPVLENRPLSWLEALFFVVETITTVGYGEMLPFTSQATVLLVMFIMVTGVFNVLMIVPVMLAPYIAALLQSMPPRRTPFELEHHVVIIGYGELTRALVESLMIIDVAVVIVEQDEKKARDVLRRYRRDLHVVWGDYNDPATWSNAWVENADNIIICEKERTTATIILGIREKTAGRIIAVVDDLSFDRYLRYAGAEYVLSPKNSTGKILARHAVLRPDVDTIYEAISLDRMKISKDSPASSLKLIKVPIMEGCRSTGKSLAELALFERYGIEVLFFWKAGSFVMHPSGSDTIDTSTMLFLLGRTNELNTAIESEFRADVPGEPLAVIAGYGDVGRAAFRELTSSGITGVVIDKGEQDVAFVIGDAEKEPVLKEAHIEDARFLIVAVNDDNVNIFATLIARNLNPQLRILARANEPASIDKLYRAGADYVALLPTIGGQVVAGIVLSDIVQVLLDLPNGQKVVMKHLMKGSAATAGWIARKSGVRIIGIEGGGRSIIRPADGDRVEQGDAIIAVGDIPALKRFIRLVSGG
ncbi:MAG: potassium transporter TrkA [Methanomicrobiales archaeon]|nr:potassium transporter TrkA [Methanomicrobiales archaeon]